MSPAAMALLDHYRGPATCESWKNAIERAMVVAQEPEIREEDFALRLPVTENAPRTLEDVEREHVLSVLQECKGNQTLAAEVLDVERVTL